MKHLLRAAPALMAPTVLMALAVILPLTAATSQPAPPPGGEISAVIRKEVLTELANQLKSQYVFESTAKQLAALVRSKQKSNAYKNLKTGPELARAVTEDLAAVAHDKHLRVYYSFKPISADAPGGSEKDFLEDMRKRNGLVPKVEILDGNVGYIRVDGVPPPAISQRAVAAAFAFVHETDALIIDNRGNGGGDPNTVALYVSYLSEGPPKVINSFHWRESHEVVEFKTTDLGELSYGPRKPVYVLASHVTFSGGEELTYDLQVSKRAVIVGEVTGGGANPGGPESLGHQFGVFMPRGQPVNPITGTNWEGKGIQPDVPVPAATALEKAQSLAIERLAAYSSDPAARAALNAISLKLRAQQGEGHAP